MLKPDAGTAAFVNDLKILFFDIGNVFVSDDPSGCFAYRQLFERLNSNGHPVTVEEFFHRRTEHIRNKGSLWSFVSQYITEAEFKAWQREVRQNMYSQWSRLSPAVTSMAEVPTRLAPHYRLGIIANQPGEVEQVLEERGLLKHFEVLGISDKLNLHKPDPRFFQWALEQAGVQPHEALMVGDRIDNDIRPANQIGMRTAWLRLGCDGREWQPEDDFEKQYFESIKLANWSDWEPVTDEDQPDLVVHSAEELVQALLPPDARLA